MVAAALRGDWTEARRLNADRYRTYFKDYGLNAVLISPVEPFGYYHVYNQFVIRVPARDALKKSAA